MADNNPAAEALDDVLADLLQSLRENAFERAKREAALAEIVDEMEECKQRARSIRDAIIALGGDPSALLEMHAERVAKLAEDKTLGADRAHLKRIADEELALS